MLATFFDVKRAFDTVWHSKLLDKLGKIGVSGRMYKFIASFLSNRSLQVKIGQSFSKEHFLDMGVPQGSVIAPTLFSIMLHDITTLDLDGAVLSQFADDIALWETNKPKYTKHSKNLERFQKKVDLLVNYMENNGFALSPEKTVFSHHAPVFAAWVKNIPLQTWFARKKCGVQKDLTQRLFPCVKRKIFG